MKVKRQSIYLAGCYRSQWGVIGEIINIIKAYRVGRRLTKQGYCVYIPHMNTALMDIGCNTDQFFLDCGIKMLKKFEIIYMMSGWRKSIGAILEYGEAKKSGMTVWYEDVDDTLEDVERRCSEAQIDMNPNWGKIEGCTPPVNCQIKTDCAISGKSKCCQADMRLDGDDKEGTHYYVCEACQKPCDVYLPDKLEPQEVKPE
jgi:hypothetical protein